MPSSRSPAAAPVRSGRLSEDAPLVLLVCALGAAAAALLAYGWNLTFFQDSWEFLMHRRELSAAALFDPHGEHIVVIPVLIQWAGLQIFGMDTMTPELILLVAMLAATAVLLFVYVRRRLGPWPALFAAVLMLFLGPAWQDLLWPFQVGYVGSAMCGLAALLALEREDERGDLVACGLLVLAVLFGSLGLPFLVAAAVDVLQGRRARGLRRAYLVGLPLLLYAAWYAGWGHEAESHLSGGNVLDSPLFVAEGLAASVDALLALATIFGEAVGRSDWAWVALGALVALLAYGLYRRRAVDPRVWSVAAATATFWLLAAFNEIPGREAWSSRYLYVGALFLLLLAADLLRGVRFSRWALLAGGAATVAIAILNLTPLREGRDFFESQTVLTRADLGAIEIARGTVDPEFALSPEIAGTSFLNEIRAGEYLRAVEEYGSPAYTPAELERAPEAGRVQADRVLANALPLGIETDAEPAPGSEPCLEDGEVGVLRPGTTAVYLRPGPPATFRLRRFARNEYPLVAEGIEGGSTTRFYVPRDDAPQPWHLRVDAPQGALHCAIDGE